MRKRCIRCKKKKNIKNFSKDNTRKDRRHPYCKECVKQVSKPYFDSHKDEASKRSREWYRNNEDKVKEYYSQEEVKARRKNYMRAYRATHKDRKNETAKQYESKRCKSDLNYKLAVNLRKRLGIAIKNGQKAGSAVKDLGCSIEELKKYLESKFEPGMTWNNWGLGIGNWQIDHIKPLCSFNLSKREEFLRACNFINLQPLWFEDHILKTVLDVSNNKNEKDALR
ncbi:MAG TPA: hypothetical protein VN855_00105 [Candidatus Acidoferrum sp.]|nr:hypothetical protein [Candidatus Acidoferrum sp.]